ncbi:hypothetical protein DM02DRAFT_546418 [Periconia macrospinosa]|uniref:TolA, Membrane protein involved in colicin uptake n=1 Tax=Periconia macrospinosa TaxID=97972 RepID=A0A2V1D0I0_9PLEO|nr:hypothetical protein DM02DRAFT_546418 [Periconia macrospinosa]
MDRQLQHAVTDTTQPAARAVRSLLHGLQVENELLKHENEGLQVALRVKQRHQKKSKPLDLQQREEYHGGGVFWSPRKVREAQTREAVKQREREQEKLQKAERRELQRANKRYKKQIAEEKRVERAALKLVREKERAAKAAQRAAQKAALNTKNSIQAPAIVKRKASALSTPKNKRRRQVADAAAAEEPPRAAPLAPARTTRSGRNVNLPSKFR